jgi:hypothetical protein
LGDGWPSQGDEWLSKGDGWQSQGDGWLSMVSLKNTHSLIYRYLEQNIQLSSSKQLGYPLLKTHPPHTLKQASLSPFLLQTFTPLPPPSRRLDLVLVSLQFAKRNLHFLPGAFNAFAHACWTPASGRLCIRGAFKGGGIRGPQRGNKGMQYSPNRDIRVSKWYQWFSQRGKALKGASGVLSRGYQKSSKRCQGSSLVANRINSRCIQYEWESGSVAQDFYHLS